MTGVALRLANLEDVHRRHDHFLAGQSRVIGEALTFGGRAAIEHVQQYPEFKPRTGALQKATRARVVRMANGRVLRITNPKVYAEPIDKGARRHLIRPRNAQYLQFKTRDGHWVRTKLVHHPGNRPYKTFYRATTAAYRVIGEDLSRRLAELARRF